MSDKLVVKSRGQTLITVPPPPNKWKLTGIRCPICKTVGHVEELKGDYYRKIDPVGPPAMTVPMRRCTECKMILHMYEEEEA